MNHEYKVRMDWEVEGMKAEGKRKGSRSSRRGGGLTTTLKLMLALLLALLILPLMAGGAQAAPGDIMLVSSDASGVEGNAQSFNPRISSDGRYIVFQSSATNLVTPATSGLQIFRKDVLTGEVRLVSADAAGVEGNSASFEPRVSADGRYVSFFSAATNLVTPATTGQQVFRKDMLTGEVKLVSADAAGVEGNIPSTISAISDDGRYVAFYSGATNLVTPATVGIQAFRKDLATGEIRLASADAAGTQGNANTLYWPNISPDGRYVYFSSASTNLVTPATSGDELFRKDMATGAVVLVSSDAAGAESNNANGFPSCSCDSRYVSFASNATNLIPGVTGTQVYRKDLHSGAIMLVSADPAGTQGNGTSTYSAISWDGRYVAFDSVATNLVTPATTTQNIFRKDLATGAVVLTSADAAGAEGNNISMIPDMTPDARYVAFHSFATNLVTPATTGQQVFKKELAAPYHFYFAEGYTGAGFQEYLCLGNAGAAPVAVKTTYLYKDGTTKEETYNVPANSRATVDVNAVVGPDEEVSIKCECPGPFIAERPMYFAYQGAWTGGHDAVGATSPALSWYFAEGYTGAGFDEWICVLNPGDLPADLTFRFQTQEEGEKVVTGFVVGPETRASFKANDLLGGAYQTSLKLESDRCVVAERPMYFSYSGTGGWGWTGGHCVMGASILGSQYYFAEGTTRAGFEEWLTIQNPGDADITVQATYFLGEGAPVVKDYPVPAGRRSTVLVNSPDVGVGAEKDVSVLLACPDPFLAERPMYFDYSGLGDWGWTGGHCVIGSARSATDWFFAEGYTGDGFEQWLCIQNPGAAGAAVAVTYYPEGGGAPVTRNHNVGANSRFTVPVNVDAGPGQSISAMVTSTVPVIVERPMYFNFRDMYPGGHDVVGFIP